MTVIYDPACKLTTTVLPCRSCKQLVYFSLTPAGKRAPFEVDELGRPTRTNHFTTCPDSTRWSKSKQRVAKHEDQRSPRLF